MRICQKQAKKILIINDMENQSDVKKEQGIVPPPPPSQSECVSACSNEIPGEIKGWNWGAFFFNWIWSVFHGIYWPLAVIVISFIPFVGFFFSIAVSILLGIKGNEWSWKAKKWPSVEAYKRRQRKWTIAIFWVLAFSFVFGFLYPMMVDILCN